MYEATRSKGNYRRKVLLARVMRCRGEGRGVRGQGPLMIPAVPAPRDSESGVPLKIYSAYFLYQFDKGLGGGAGLNALERLE